MHPPLGLRCAPWLVWLVCGCMAYKMHGRTFSAYKKAQWEGAHGLRPKGLRLKLAGHGTHTAINKEYSFIGTRRHVFQR